MLYVCTLECACSRGFMLLIIDAETTSMYLFFFNDTATTEIYTLSLHDALPISQAIAGGGATRARAANAGNQVCECGHEDRKSTRLNSSHSQISYAVFCLKKKKNTPKYTSCTIKSNIVNMIHYRCPL